MAAFLPRLAFPNRQHLPSPAFKLCLVCGVPLLVPAELWLPVVEPGFRDMGQLAGRIAVLVPKASVHEDHFAARAEHKIGFAEQVFPVQPVAVAHAMHELPDDHFRLHTL